VVSRQMEPDGLLECTTVLAGNDLENIAVVLATTLTDTPLQEANVRCHALVFRVPIAPIFAADSIMQARLHEDVFPRAIGGKLDVSCMKRKVAPG